MKKTSKLTSEEFDAVAETGQSLLPRLRIKTARRVNRGGVREGAGRKSSGRSGRTVRSTNSVWENLEAEAAQTGVSVSVVIERRVRPARRVGIRT